MIVRMESGGNNIIWDLDLSLQAERQAPQKRWSGASLKILFILIQIGNIYP